MSLDDAQVFKLSRTLGHCLSQLQLPPTRALRLPGGRQPFIDAHPGPLPLLQPHSQGQLRVILCAEMFPSTLKPYISSPQRVSLYSAVANVTSAGQELTCWFEGGKLPLISCHSCNIKGLE